MVRAKCINSTKKTINNKKYWKLQDEHGNTSYVEENAIKFAIIKGKIEIEDLVFDKPGRLYFKREHIAKKEHNHELLSRKQCQSLHINYNRALLVSYFHPEIDWNDLVYWFSNKERTLKEKCNIAGIDYEPVYKYKLQNPKKNDNEIIMICLEKGTSSKITEISRVTGVDYNDIVKIRNKFPGMTKGDYVVYIEEHRLTLDYKCRVLGLSLWDVEEYISENNKLTEDEALLQCIIINEQKENKEISFNSKCKAFGLSTGNVYPYRRMHKDLTDNEVIEGYISKRIRIKQRKEKQLERQLKKQSEEQSKKKSKKQSKDKSKDKNKEHNTRKFYTSTRYISSSEHDKRENEKLAKQINRKENKERLRAVEEECNKLNIDYVKVRAYISGHPQYTRKEIIGFFKENKKPTIRESMAAMDRYKELNIIAEKLRYNIRDLMDYKENNLNLSNEELVKHYLIECKKMETDDVDTLWELKEMDDKAEYLGVDSRVLLNYKEHHPELSNEEVARKCIHNTEILNSVLKGE